MECDSIHSKIEKKVKHVPVYVPEGWAQIIRGTRLNPEPFSISKLEYNDFYDFTSLVKELKGAIPWRKVCSLEFHKGLNGKVETFYKTEYKDKFQPVALRRRKGRPINEQLNVSQACVRELCTSQAKLKDLMKICQDVTVPKKCHQFYSKMKASGEVRDNLPAPDLSEYEELTINMHKQHVLLTVGILLIF